jgi:hypothetical protein
MKDSDRRLIAQRRAQYSVVSTDKIHPRALEKTRLLEYQNNFRAVSRKTGEKRQKKAL